MSYLKPKEMLSQHLAEYNQVCEHYRQGFRLVIDASRLYMILQAGLGTAFSFLVTHPTVTQSYQLTPHIKLNLTVLTLSIIGLLTGPGAYIVARRFYKYYDSGMERAIQIERNYNMSLMTSLELVWRSGASFGKAMNVAIILFLMIAAFWIIGIWQSVTLG
jgi:hypothetical protein